MKERKMIKLFLYSFMLSSIFVLGSPVLASDEKDSKEAILRKSASNPFVSRLQRAQNAEKEERESARSLYPETLNAEQIKLIINSPLKRISSLVTKREAVPLNDPKLGEIKVSSKVQNTLLNSIKEAIDIRVLNGEVEGLTIYDDMQITVHPHVTARFHQICQATYQGSTAQEEEKKTGKRKKGQLIEYILIKDRVPIQYLSQGSRQKSDAKLILSITTQE